MLDDQAWSECDVLDLWIYDKLILSRRLGHICGPAGVDVPYPATYITRPITNIDGMGIGAKFVHLEKKTDNGIVPPGHFWCEIFTGRHLSVDYVGGEQRLCVEGIRSTDTELYRWDRWMRVDDDIPLPMILSELSYSTINCEFIGGSLIEVHLRGNPDFTDDVQEVIPVWKDQLTVPPKGYVYQHNPDFERQGFFVKYVK